MSGSLQILRQELPLSDEQSQLMDIVLRESDRLNDTIRSFLAYARPQRNALAGSTSAGSPTRARCCRTARSSRGARIRCDVPTDPVWCLADEAQIRQIVWNLATNGLRAMAEGGALTLAASPAAADDGKPPMVTIAVSDEGIGIDPEELDSILQPFHGGFARGTGLGLSIVHRIVNDYGGELLMTSERGRGTTVTVKLPAAGQELSALSCQL